MDVQQQIRNNSACKASGNKLRILSKFFAPRREGAKTPSRDLKARQHPSYFIMLCKLKKLDGFGYSLQATTWRLRFLASWRDEFEVYPVDKVMQFSLYSNDKRLS